MDKRLAKGVLGDSNGTLYTVPADHQTIVKAVTITNITAEDEEFTLQFAGQEVVCDHTIRANDTLTIPFIDQILIAADLIEGEASEAAAINYYISGKEVDVS